MLCSQLGGDIVDEKVETSRDTEATDDESDSSDEATEMWESDMEHQYEEQKSTLVEANLKNRFLDRLAEVLARIKRPPEAVKQIASVYMKEMDDNDGSQRVEIRLAKNEGPSGQDNDYLKMLFGLLMQIARGGRAAQLG